jgi:4-carboxymuconolactone decarboxylase
MKRPVMTTDNYQRGESLLKEKRPDEYANLHDNYDSLSPDIARYVIEFAYGDIWSRPGIDLKTKAIVTVTTLAAIGGAEPQLRSHINGALKSGCTKQDLLEVFIQMIPYAGLPRALNALKILKEAS